MKYKLSLPIFLSIGMLFAAGLIGGTLLFAQEEHPLDTISFPIPELGNCGSQEECAVFCEQPEHYDACGAWAEEHGFVEDEALRVKAEVPPEGGPGGCNSEESCRAYCDDPTHVEECVGFALDHGYITPEEAARELRGGPGGCRGEECEAYCADPANEVQCIEFAVDVGDLTRAEADKILRGGPGGCRGHRECQAYCSDPANQDECLDFAVAEGHLTAGEARQIRAEVTGAVFGDLRVPDEFGPGELRPEVPGARIDHERAVQVLEETGGGPGGCQNERECDAFCSNPQNGKACLDFAIEHGLIDTAQADKFKRLLETEGPGGCIGVACEAYCEAPGRELECLAFAEDNGLMPPEAVAQARKFLQATADGGPGGCRGRECEAYCSDPTHRDECFEFAKSSGILPPEELERIEKLQTLGKKVEEEGGPGGCRSERDCMAYCSDPAHFDECAAFAVNEGLLSSDEAARSLRELIEGDFGPDSFGPGGAGDFGPGGLPPELENIPPEFREKFEQEFQSRFEQFKQYQGQFEQGGVPPGGFPPPQDFPASEDFPTGDFPPPDEFSAPSSFEAPSGNTDAHVTLTRKSSGLFELVITDSQGIQDFFLGPQDGLPYSGTLSCEKEFKTETAAFGQMKFPLTSYVIDCSGNTFEFVIPALANYDSWNPPVPDIPTPEEFLPEGIDTFLEGFEGTTGGFPSPEDIQRQMEEEKQRQIEEQLQQFGLPGGEGPSPEDLQNLSPEELEKLKSLYQGEFEGTYPEGTQLYLLPRGSLMANIIKLFGGLLVR